MNEALFTVICMALFFTLSFICGWSANEIYERSDNQRTLNGLYFPYADKEFVDNVTKSKDKYGDWVCVNVAYDMDYPLAYETCVHECSHKAFSEIYAEQCEKDINLCMDELRRIE